MSNEHEALAAFTEYFVRNYPGPNTIIHDPNWHAPRIFAAAKKALATPSPSTDPLREDVRFLAAHVKVNADKLPSPDQARMVCDRILAGLVAPSTNTLEGAVKVPTLRQLDKLWANTGGKAWEPKGGTDHPLIAAMIDGGWVKRCVMRCGFEAMDTGLNWTDAARAFFAARNTGGSHD